MSAYFDSLNRRARSAQVAPAPVAAPRPARPAVAPVRRIGSGGFATEFAAMRERILLRSQGHPMRCLVVAGCGGGEGSARVVRGFAENLAGSGLNVLLVDAEQRAIEAGEPTGTAVDLGAVAAANLPLTGESVGSGHLTAVRAAMGTAEKERVLRSPEFAAWLDAQRSLFDYVLLHFPPVLQSAEATIVGRLADGVVVVVEADVTPRALLARVREQLENAKVRIVGAVLNRAHDPVPPLLRPYLNLMETIET